MPQEFELDDPDANLHVRPEFAAQLREQLKRVIEGEHGKPLDDILSDLIQTDVMRMDEEEGCFNPRADEVKRVDKTWSDWNLDGTFPPDYVFDRLLCRNCSGIAFAVLHTGDYETSAHCLKCGMYYIVHNG